MEDIRSFSVLMSCVTLGRGRTGKENIPRGEQWRKHEQRSCWRG